MSNSYESVHHFKTATEDFYLDALGVFKGHTSRACDLSYKTDLDFGIVLEGFITNRFLGLFWKLKSYLIADLYKTDLQSRDNFFLKGKHQINAVQSCSRWNKSTTCGC